jgi:rhomboid protease GluP
MSQPGDFDPFRRRPGPGDSARKPHDEFPAHDLDAGELDPDGADPAGDDADSSLELSADMLAEDPRPKGFNFERDMSRLPKLSTALVLFLTAVFIWQVASGALQNERAILRAGALQRKAVLAGEWWRIPTSMNLHADFDHLIGNCIGLFLMGLAVEHAFGIAWSAVIYFTAGVLGAIFCLIFEGGTTVGASGAIFGFWGAAISFLYLYRNRLLAKDVRVGFVLLVWAAWTIFTGFLSPNISNWSHVGGLLAGAALALVIPTRLTELRNPAVES